MNRHSVRTIELGLFLVGVLVGFQLLSDPGAWGRYASLIAAPAMSSSRGQARTPGPRIIFRLDDVQEDVRESQTFAIVSLFARQRVPLDLGIIPRAHGKPSYALPRLRPYVREGDVDIDVHGITHKLYEFDSRRSRSSERSLARGLSDVTRRITEYYRVRPVAFLVPYDVFDGEGYDAVRDAGFRVFSSQWQTDRYRGIGPVDFGTHPDPRGLYRLPAVDDVISWNATERSWGDFQPMSNLLFSVRASLRELGVAVISLHPAGFQTRAGRTDTDKLDKLARFVDEVRKLGRIATFRNWYCTYAAGREPERAKLFCGPSNGRR